MEAAQDWGRLRCVCLNNSPSAPFIPRWIAPCLAPIRLSDKSRNKTRRSLVVFRVRRTSRAQFIRESREKPHCDRLGATSQHNENTLMKLSLSVKFNLVFLIIFAIGLSGAGVLANRLLQQQALEETMHDANVLLSAAESMQDYTAAHITPLLETQMKYRFVPESIPAFSAIEMVNLLQ